MTAKTTTIYRFEIFDGRGIATVWKVEETRRGREVEREYVGTVYGVHDEREAREAATAEGMIR